MNKEIKTSEIWSQKKKNELKNFILSQSARQPKERKLRNELLAIQFQMEDYIETNNYSDKRGVIDFVKMYLKALNVSQKKLATLFEMKDSNLHKYLAGERRLNPVILLKLCSFSHTPPEYWLRIQVKNELGKIMKNKKAVQNYKKYDYKNLLISADL